MLFHDRHDAGRCLAATLQRFRDADVLVLALPRGGVPVAFEVAQSLDAPLDVFPVRKLGLPGREELAIGALAPGGVQVLDQQVIDRFGVSNALIETVAQREQAELARQEAAFRRGGGPAEIRDRTVILVDDGLATGSTMRAAVTALRRRQPKWIVAAVPVGAPESCAEMAEVADECACAASPQEFSSVGAWYADFEPATDDEVVTLLERAAQRRQTTAGASITPSGA